MPFTVPDLPGFYACYFYSAETIIFTIVGFVSAGRYYTVVFYFYKGVVVDRFCICCKRCESLLVTLHEEGKFCCFLRVKKSPPTTFVFDFWYTNI